MTRKNDHGRYGKNRVSRRTLLKGVGVGAGLAAAGVMPWTAKAAEDKTVIFAGWGGNWQKAERTFYFDSFEKASGIKVIDVPNVNLAKIKTMVDAKNVEWDVVQALGMWVPQKASSGDLWEKLDYSVIKTDGVPKDLVDPYGVSNASFAMILAYNTKAYPAGKAQPASWVDFWDIKKFPGKRGTLNQPRYSLEMALLADGVPMDKLYPLDVDRAFKKWDTIKSNTLFWDQWPQAPTLLASGELTMTLSNPPRILGLLQTEKNAPVAIAWKQGIMTTDFLCVPRGSKRKENAFKLISWMLDAKLQAAYATDTTVGPSNFKALDLLDAKTKEMLPSYRFQKGDLVSFDRGWWAANIDKMTERWNQWKLKA